MLNDNLIAVLEMVEKMQPASKTEDQQDDLYKEYQNIDLYGMANGFCKLYTLPSCWAGILDDLVIVY